MRRPTPPKEEIAMTASREEVVDYMREGRGYDNLKPTIRYDRFKRQTVTV